MKIAISILSVFTILLFAGSVIYSIATEKPLKRTKTQIRPFKEQKLDSLCSLHLPSDFEMRKKKVIYLNNLQENDTL